MITALNKMFNKKIQSYKNYINNKDTLNHNKSIEYNLLCSEMCGLPVHLKEMLYDIDENQNEIFKSFKNLPIVLCQRDFWVENIFYDNGKIIVIDWDTSGFGYFGEDIAQLVIDDVDCNLIPEYINKLIPAYYNGFYESSKIEKLEEKQFNKVIRNFILIKFGYRIVQDFIYSNDNESINNAQRKLQYIYDLL